MRKAHPIVTKNGENVTKNNEGTARVDRVGAQGAERGGAKKEDIDI